MCIGGRTYRNVEMGMSAWIDQRSDSVQPKVPPGRTTGAVSVNELK